MLALGLGLGGSSGCQRFSSDAPACLQDYRGLIPTTTTSTVPCLRARTVFAEDFESGGYGRWTNQSYGLATRCATSALSAERAVSGTHSSRSEVRCAASDSHRPYGAIQLSGDQVMCRFTNSGVGLSAPHGILTTFWGWLDAPYDFGPGKWFSYFTLNPACDFSETVVTFSLFEPKRTIEAAHVWDTGGRVRFAPDAPTYPLRQWVRTTIYFDIVKGELTVWMDGAKVLDAWFTRKVKTLCQLHWGLYASPANDQLTYFEDDIALYVLDEPLTDREHEPWLGHSVSMCASQR